MAVAHFKNPMVKTVLYKQGLINWLIETPEKQKNFTAEVSQ